MAHYVDLDKAQVIMTQRGCGKSAFLDALRKLPKEDVVPVVHAKWVDMYNIALYKCTNCTQYAEYIFDYCPHCGAKMDEEEKENL